MLFVKKFMFGLGAVLFILWGGAGTQSNNTLLQGGGLMILLVGLVVLYLFIRMAWRAMGCLPSFLIFSGIIIFILYAIGAFNGGVENVIPNLKSFLGQKNQTNYSTQAATSQPKITTGEKIGNFVDNLSENFSSDTTPASSLNNLPSIRSSVRVIKGNVLQIQGYYLQLFAVDAPDNDQICADKKGRSYKCGLKSASWLRDWIQDYEIDCKIMHTDKYGNMAGVCFLGQYDLGAALVTAGWGVANTRHSDIYVPYEQEAQRRHNGLWSGTFYRPQDWRDMKQQKPNIKIIKPKNPNKKGFWGF